MTTIATNSTFNIEPFEILNASETRADLARRMEIKFSFPCADVAKLRHTLQGACRAVAHNESISTVRSVYFDDLRYSACHANLDGISRRRKLRLRWYDRPKPLHDFFFEIKWRENRVTGKHRLHMRGDRPLAEYTYREITRKLEKSLPIHLMHDVWTNTNPTVLVQYQRQHFVARDGPLRLTVDYNLRFYDQTGKRRLSTSFGKNLGNLVVVEGKTPVGEEKRLREILHPFAARARRCSKYVTGCKALGLVADDAGP